MTRPKIEELPLDVGDIILTTQNRGFLSKAIRWFTSIHTGHARVSHVAIYIGQGLCIEALSTIRINKVEKYNDPKQGYIIYSPTLAHGQKEKLFKNIVTKASGQYGWGKILLFALDGLTTAAARPFGRKTPVFFFTKHFNILSFPVCSQFAVYALQKWAGYYIRETNRKVVDWRIISPDYLDDLLQIPINNARLVANTLKE